MLVYLIGGGKDITRNIVLESYKMDSSPVYEEWKDANGTYRREKIRNRITGSFQVMCAPQLGMTTEQFEAALEGCKSTSKDTYNLNVYVSNKDTVKKINAFVKVSTGTYAHRVTTFDITVEEE